MKLYATVTSERATKGQGGNKFLAIQVKDEKEKCILTIAMNFDGLGQWHIAKAFGEYRAMCEMEKAINESIMGWLYKQEKKGKKQKGERKCLRCGDPLRSEDDLICGHHNLE